MSIITDALKKAEKEKNKTAASSKEYVNKIIGPERKGTYRPEGIKVEEAGLQVPISSSEEETVELSDVVDAAKRSKAFLVSGGLVALAIIFLTVANIFLVPYIDEQFAARKELPDYGNMPLKAEAYTDMSPEVALIERKAGLFNTMAKAFKGDAIRDEFQSSFALNGIVQDIEGYWAVVNNRVVRAGDMVDGAKIIAIEPERVVLNFKDERFDLVLK